MPQQCQNHTANLLHCMEEKRKRIKHRCAYLTHFQATQEHRIQGIERLAVQGDSRRRLVVILAGAVCYIWDFFLVHSYAGVGLYQFSTLIHCRLARTQKYPYAKVTTKIAIVPLTFHLIICVKPNQKPWGLSTTASAAVSGPLMPIQA
jgi:hypothetical protein